MTEQATRGHENLVARALVRILSRSGDHVGFGLLVAERRVVTCAHVVAGSVGEPDELPAPPSRGRVLLDFPFIAPGKMLTAVASAWRAMASDGSGDVAGLVLDEEVPDGACPLAMTRGGNLRGHAILAYGYQAGLTGGVPSWVPGVIVDRTERGWLQLGISEDAGGLRIREGFSGTPVWDAQIGQVVGLVVRASMSRNVRLAFAVSGETVFDAWPDLRESFLRASPFRGLMPFQAGDGNFFFGRDELTADAVDVITRSDSTVVSGPSGAGKTSMMNAAVIPQLERQGHAVITIRPLTRDSLWETLAAALAESYFPAPGAPASGGLSDRQRTEAQLTKSFTGETVQSRVRRLCDYLGGDRVIVVVDQSEELMRADGLRARAFCWDVGQLPSVRHPEGRAFVRIVIVVREDDEGQLRSLPPLDGDTVSVIHVGALSISQLRAAVEEPVRRTGFARYEEKLPDRIIDEVRVQPYVLPALQVILTELWERQGLDGLLRHSVYQDLNRGAGPLATHLERLWKQLTPADRDTARRLFLHFVVPVGDAFARRTASQAEVNPGDWPIAGTLATQRLVVLRGSPSGGATAELVHDSLINQWPALADHLSAHRNFLQWRDDLRRRISAWQQSGRQPSQLLTGAALKRGLAQQDALPGQVSEREREFLLLSRSRIRKLRRRAFLSAATVLTLIAVLLTFAVTQRQNARQNANVALSRNLADTAGQLAASNPQLAALLSVAAYRVSDTSEAQVSLAQQLSNLKFVDRFLNISPAGVNGIALSPGGRTLFACSSQVTMWDMRTGGLIATLPTSTCNGMALSPDGHTLAVVNLRLHGASAVTLWDTTRRVKLATLAGQVGPVVFSPDGRILAIGNERGGAIGLWDVARRTRIARLTIPQPEGQSAPEGNGEIAIAFSHDGRYLAADSTLTPVPPAIGPITVVWDLKLHKIVARLQGGHTRGVFSLAFSPDGRILASGGHDAKVVLWDLARQTPMAILHADGDVNSLAFSPDGRSLATGDAGRHVIIWNIAAHSRRETLTGHTAAVNSVAFSRDGRTLVSAGADGKAILWNETAHNDLALTSMPTPATLPNSAGIEFSPNGQILAAVGGNTTTLWATSQHVKLATIPIKAAPIGFTPDGKTLILFSSDGNLIVWDTAQRRELASTSLPGAAGVAALSPDGNTVAYVTGSSSVALWNISRGEAIGVLHGRGQTGFQPTSLAISPDGRILAVGGAGISLWDLSSRIEIGSLPTSPGLPVQALAFSHDGTVLASAQQQSAATAIGCSGCSITLWNVSSRTMTTTLIVNTTEPRTLAFSPDGSILASGSDSDVILWSALQRTRIVTLNAPGPVAFSPQGNLLATTSGWVPAGPAGITLWNVNTAKWADELCRIVGRNLTRTEWSTYVSGQAFRLVCSG